MREESLRSWRECRARSWVRLGWARFLWARAGLCSAAGLSRVEGVDNQEFFEDGILRDLLEVVKGAGGFWGFFRVNQMGGK